ncbi:hypothetical protein D3C78_1117250 [compost metagenome]
MVQVQLVLTGGRFGHHAGERQRLQSGLMLDVVEQGVVAFRGIDRKTLRRALAGNGGLLLRIMQIKLQFCRDHRVVTFGLQAFENLLQHHARFQFASLTFGIFHRQQQLSVVLWVTGAGAQCARYRQAQPVRLPGLLAQPAFFNDLACEIHGVDRQREIAALFQPEQLGDRQPFATELTV